MQPISFLLAFLVGSMVLFTMTYARVVQNNQENEHQMHPVMADARIKRSLANKRFYDFGARSISNLNDEEFEDVNEEFNRLRRFYDFGSKKRLVTRFYDFGSKKKRSNE